MTDRTARWRVLTPGSAAGAIAGIELTGSAGDIDSALARLGAGAVEVGQVVLRSLAGVDRGLVARWTGGCVHLMPHGGLEVMRALAGAIGDAGMRELGGLDDASRRVAYPEASDDIEAHVLEVLARAPSPRGIDLLLDQPRRWRLHELGKLPGPDVYHSAVLARLLEPPMVAAIGASNIGKSSLTNALAGRRISITADEAGTTRDHVGVMLELDGLAVRFVDTPGLRREAPGIEWAAQEAAGEIVRGADIVLLCGDKDAPPPDALSLGCKGMILTVLLRSDLGAPATWPADVVTSARTGAGVRELSDRIRRELTPDRLLTDPRPWRFWR